MPTHYGEALIRHGKLLMAQLTHAAEELEDLAEGTGGRISVGTLLAASAVLLPSAIARLRKKRPRVSVAVVEGTNDRLMPALRVGDLDLVVGRLPELRFGEDLVHEALYEERTCVVVRKTHPLARRRSLAIADLAEWEWILQPPETTLRSQIDKAFQDAGLASPRPSVQSVSLLTNRRLLLTTDMISVWPYHVIAEDVRRRDLTILPIVLPAVFGAVGISRRRNGILSPAAQALVDELKSASEDIAENEV